MDKYERKQKVRVKPSDYRPTKAELEEVHHIDANPEDLIRPVRGVEDLKA
ncbi:MAG: hypothetical protein OXC62_06745 [Aestuariivita sp.]|nr:hypothetical protein [Aestuariivita sp.]